MPLYAPCSARLTEMCERLKILYGGSVTPDNIRDLIEMKDIDGALIGGASLKSETFLGIIQKIVEKRSC